MRIYFDVNCGEKVSPEDLSSLLDKTMDFLTGDQNWLVQSVEDGGILDTIALKRRSKTMWFLSFARNLVFRIKFHL